MIKLTIPVLLGALALGACSDESTSGAVGAQPTPSTEAAALLLPADPGDAVGVLAARSAATGERVVVEGRVHDITQGFAMLKLMDTAMEYCGQGDADDKCSTPWDYCCDTKEERVAHSLLVEFRGPDGRPLATPALPATRYCDLLKVTGELVHDAQGNAVLVADGLFRVERPELPDYVKLPSGS